MLYTQLFQRQNQADYVAGETANTWYTFNG